MAAKTSKVAFNIGYDTANNGYRYGAGSFSTNQTSAGNVGGTANYCSFLRFVNVMIPKGATITAAYVRYYEGSAHTGETCNLNVYLVDADNPAAPTSAAEYDALELTTGFAWNAVPITAATTWYNTPSLVADLQAVIDRAGWAEGNPVIVLFKDNSSSSGAFRQFGQGDTGNNGILYVEFTHATKYRMTCIANTDCFRRGSSEAIDASPEQLYLGDIGDVEYGIYVRFDLCALLKDSTITAATLYLLGQGTYTDTVAVTASLNDHDDSVAPTSNAEWVALALTTANAVLSMTTDVALNSWFADITGFHLAVQEVLARAGWVPDQALGIVLAPGANATNVDMRFAGSDYVTANNGSGRLAYSPLLALTFADPPIPSSNKIMVVA